MKLLQLPCCEVYVNPEHVASVETDSVYATYVGSMGTRLWGVRVRTSSGQPHWVPCESEDDARSMRDELALKLMAR